MYHIKRKAAGVDLERRVRVRRESAEELEPEHSLNGDKPADEESTDSNSNSDSEEDEVYTPKDHPNTS